MNKLYTGLRIMSVYVYIVILFIEQKKNPGVGQRAHSSPSLEELRLYSFMVTNRSGEFTTTFPIFYVLLEITKSTNTSLV